VPPAAELPEALLKNIEFDNLSFITAVLPQITANYCFASTGNYLIHEAVKAGAIKVLHFICTKGADMNVKSRAGESALTLGAEENKHDAMCIILQHGRERMDLEFENMSGMTALQIAVRNGNKEIVGLLVAHGANVNATNVLGDSLIKMAQRAGHQEIVLLLVNSGASLR
jgi:ankyrin repeat protein